MILQLHLEFETVMLVCPSRLHLKGREDSLQVVPTNPLVGDTEAENPERAAGPKGSESNSLAGQAR